MSDTTRPRGPVSDQTTSPPAPNGSPGVLRPECRPELGESTAVVALEADASRKGQSDKRGDAYRKLAALARERPDVYADPGYDSDMLPSLAFLHHRRVDTARQALLA